MQQEPPILADSTLVNEVQLILAEKRTALSTLRSGISILVLPLSVLSLLVTTSRYYEVMHVIGWLIPLLIITTALAFLGAYLIIRALKRIHHYDRLIRQIKQKYSAIAEFIE